MPECPKQKTAFLTFPEARENIFLGQYAGRMLPDVIVFKPVIEKQIIQDGKDPDNRNRMYQECNSSSSLPQVFFSGAPDGKHIGCSGKECAYKSECDEQVSNFAENKLFTDILDIQGPVLERSGAACSYEAVLLRLVPVIFRGTFHQEVALGNMKFITNYLSDHYDLL